VSPSELVGRVPSDVITPAPEEVASMTQAFDQDPQPPVERPSPVNLPDTVDAGIATPIELTQASNRRQEPPLSTYTDCCNESLTRNMSTNIGTKNRKVPPISEHIEQWELDEMEQALGDLCGHLGLFPTPVACSIINDFAVVYPTRFLEGEDISNKCVIVYSCSGCKLILSMPKLLV
jgi:hypothetical protein